MRDAARGERVAALLGPGEFEPWAVGVDRWVLARARTGDPRVLILPTASAPEGGIDARTPP